MSFVSPHKIRIVPSGEQFPIIEYARVGKGNMLVQARAGCGKTFTIRQCLTVATGRSAIVAYNTAIAAEIDAKVREDNQIATVGTFHKFGNRVLSRALKDTKVEGHDSKSAGYIKFDRIAEELEIPNYLKSFVRKALSLGMQRGFGVLCPVMDRTLWYNLVHHYDIDSDIADDNVVVQMHGREYVIDEAIRFTIKALKRGRDLAAEVISFDDMLYMPLLLNCKFEQYDNVFIDEAQDSNPVRRAMAERMTKPYGRRFWVGDSFQSINGFTGADSDALEQIAKKDACKVFYMTETRRCSKAVVRLAQELVPDFKAHEDNAEGATKEMSLADFDKLTPTVNDAIICRNTRPLVEAAYKLIKRGIACHVEGKDIGKGLIALLDRWNHIKRLPALSDRLGAYKEAEISKLMLAKKEAAADALSDRIETLEALLDGQPKDATVADLRKLIESMFVNTKDGAKPATVSLMTDHRSKGREFRTVYGLGRKKFFPSPFATQPWMREQEANLVYVKITRAMVEYIDVVVP